MPETQPVPRTTRFSANRRMLGLCLLLPVIGCAASKPQVATVQPLPMAVPAYTGTIAAIRPETSAQDTTGSIQQIMSILGQPAPPSLDASEIVLRLTDNTVRTSVQASSTSLTAGSKAMVTAPPNVTIQPY